MPLLSFIFITLNTLFWTLALYPLVFLRLLLPGQKLRLNRGLVAIAKLWIETNTFLFRTIYRVRWKVHGLGDLSREKSYLLIVNHQAWADILILQQIFNEKIPFIRFFIKHELIYMPFLGGAWWALDFPMMKRYSRDFLRRHPEKRHDDLETTRRACEKLRNQPVALLNFLEGTRFSKQKQQEQGAPYQSLLRPRSGGLGGVISVMGDQIHSLLDVTIFYPHGAQSLWQSLRGSIRDVEVFVQERSIPPKFVGADFQKDKKLRQEFQEWVQDIWKEKDLLLSQQRYLLPFG